VEINPLGLLLIKNDNQTVASAVMNHPQPIYIGKYSRSK